MATFTLSPSVEVIEKDLSVVVPAVSTSIGAMAGTFRWGPINEPVVIDNENTLKSIFGEPDEDCVRDFLTATSFLGYSNNLRVVRVSGMNAKNAATTSEQIDNITNQPYFENDVDYSVKVDGWKNDKLAFVAKYPGVLGNSIRVSMADAETFAQWEYRDIFGSAVTIDKTATGSADDDATITMDNTNLLEVGMIVTGVGVQEGTKIKSITNSTTIELTTNLQVTGGMLALSFTKYTGAPGTSGEVAAKGGSNDELHIVIVDELGHWTGTKGTILERFLNVSKAKDALTYNGQTNYYAEVLNRQSSYVSFGGTHLEANWGGNGNTAFTGMSKQFNKALTGGVDDNKNISVAQRIKGYRNYERSDSIDISLLIVSGLNKQEDQLLLTKDCISICEKRKDCIALCSPPMDAVVGNTNKELQSILTFRGLLGSTSYAVMDSGWKYVYNKYADNYVWVPLSADIAGLCAYTDKVADAWYSPAGYNRGFIKNGIKLAFNPGSQAERDSLYVNGINPVTSQIGEGIVLFGDKTLQVKSSAFDRINVRRLFIILEKSIATAAKYAMFEFNDEFTRNNFVNMIEPYLRNVKGRRGLTDYKVVCDETNNTAEVIDKNGFIADIYLKPARSINFIQLNFVAVSTGVEFTEAIGQ